MSQITVNCDRLYQSRSELLSLAGEMSRIAVGTAHAKDAIPAVFLGQNVRELEKCIAHSKRCELCLRTLAQQLQDYAQIYQMTEKKIADGAWGQETDPENMGESQDPLDVYLAKLLKVAKVPSAAGGVATAAGALGELLNSGLIGGRLDQIEDLMGKIKNVPACKVLTYLKDATTLVDAYQKGDADKVEKLIGKYVRKGAKYAGGLTGFTGASLIYLGWNLGENAVESVGEIMADYSFVGIAKGVWNATGGAVVETGTEMAWDSVSAVYKLCGKDLDAFYEQYTGVGGIEGFYKGVGMVGDYVVEQVGDGLQAAAQTLGNAVDTAVDFVSDAAQSAADAVSRGAQAVGETVAGWGEGLRNMLKW